MSLTLVVNGNTVQATDLNQIINALQRPAGQAETGKYYISYGCDATGRIGTEHIRTTSQGSTPASVVIDQANQAATNCTAPATAQINQFAFQVNVTSNNGAQNNCKVGGNTTVNY